MQNIFIKLIEVYLETYATEKQLVYGLLISK